MLSWPLPSQGRVFNCNNNMKASSVNEINSSDFLLSHEAHLMVCHISAIKTLVFKKQKLFGKVSKALEASNLGTLEPLQQTPSASSPHSPGVLPAWGRYSMAQEQLVASVPPARCPASTGEKSGFHFGFSHTVAMFHTKTGVPLVQLIFLHYALCCHTSTNKQGHPKPRVSTQQ